MSRLSLDKLIEGLLEDGESSQSLHLINHVNAHLEEILIKKEPEEVIAFLRQALMDRIRSVRRNYVSSIQQKAAKREDGYGGPVGYVSSEGEDKTIVDTPSAGILDPQVLSLPVNFRGRSWPRFGAMTAEDHRWVAKGLRKLANANIRKALLHEGAAEIADATGCSLDEVVPIPA